jgi:chromate transport protein ChrA
LRDYVVVEGTSLPAWSTADTNWSGWVSSRDFLLIFAILSEESQAPTFIPRADLPRQAFPGPNFNFAVALGILSLTSSANPRLAPLGAFLGYVGIFLPGILLKLALLPLYSSWRDKSIAKSVIRGLNATASGLVFTAVWQLFLVGYIYQSADGTQGGRGTLSGPLTADPFWAVVASGSFLGTRSFSSPPWLSIMLGGLAGLAWYGVVSQ